MIFINRDRILKHFIIISVLDSRRVYTHFFRSSYNENSPIIYYN